MHDRRSRKKALKVAVSQSGVLSVSLIGDDNNEIEVIGEGMDPAKLTISLRKNLVYAELLSVNPVVDVVEEEVNELNDEQPRESHFSPPHEHFQYVGVVHDDACCNIM
ncbi:hypothetical protein LIER_36160 [Lithospermum erythrorhizon]|uniref:Uncharacterized protein n=1 Tax=Lithospermum erythrorhizon TaxID=34254 RepID=A0AAV3P227_LITER